MPSIEANQVAIVVGNYLYIDGGTVTSWNGIGKGYQPETSFQVVTDDGDIRNLPDNRTYSIDLRSSWTNETASLTSIYKAAPIFNSGALWPHVDGTSFYAYNGAYSYSIAVVNDTANTLWHFLPDGNSGSWFPVLPPASSNFSTLSRVGAGLYGYGEGFGFSLGGTQTGRGLLNNPAFSPGLVIYDTSSEEWFNISSTGYSWSGTASHGAAQFVPDFGSKGILFILGGDANEIDALVPFDSISMYDPVTQRWGNQKVSGEPPNPSEDLCVVGVSGDNGTYEIFAYGGWQLGGEVSPQTAATLNNGAVHVLSLPAFRWFKQTSPTIFARYGHSCNVVGSRQMVVIGGRPVTRDSNTSFIPPDPWPQGINIFDLTTMEWAGEYDPKAAAYVTPGVVKEYYQSNSRYPVWSSADVESWFDPDKSSSNRVKHKSHKTTTGAIAGGVVGGVVALVIVGCLVWYFFRRRRKSKNDPIVLENLSPRQGMAELEIDDSSRIMIGGSERHELRAKERPQEAGSEPLYELPHHS